MAVPLREELAAAFPQLEILELIGQGGMGFVYKARQPKLDRFVALKILSQARATDAAFAERFTREGRVLARLNHPAIVAVHDFGESNGFFYLLMEFVDGVNLRQAMRAGRFTPDQALAIVPRICEALQYAHNEGILHRDIKPENILLDSKGRVKIADFGIAKLLSDGQAETHLTGSGATLGTPHYMAPEQIEEPGAVDHRADIYSLGVVFYEMLTGELPLGRFAAPSERSTSDPRLDEVVFRTLEKEPSRRPQSAGEMKTAVENFAGQKSARPKGTEAASRHSSRRASLALGLLLAGILGPPLILVIFPHHPMGLIFGVMAILASLVFGVMSWRERLGKGVVITVCSLVALAGLIAAITVPIAIMRAKKARALAEQREQQEIEARAATLARAGGETAETLAQQGWQLWNSQRWTEAIDKFNQSVRLAPDNAEAWNGLGWAFFNSGALDEGLNAFEKAVAINPQHPAALNGLGQIHLMRRQYDLAETNLLRAAPEAPASWFGLARLYLIQGRFEQAEPWVDRLVDAGQGNEMTRQMLEAVKKKELPESLRRKLEPRQRPAQAPQNAAPASTENLDARKRLPEASTMRALGLRVCDGDFAALDELRAISDDMFEGVNATVQRDRALTNVILMRAALEPLGRAAGQGNTNALAALQSALFHKHLKVSTPYALGIAAAAGSEPAMDMLINYRDWNILLSTAVASLRDAATGNNDRAVQFLSEVLTNRSHRALGPMALEPLQAAAFKGNARAKAAVEEYKLANPR